MLLRDFFQHKENFLKHLVRLNRSQRTVEAYQKDLADLETILMKMDEEYKELNLELDDRNISRALMQFEKMHPRSINRKMSAWRSYEKFLLHKGIVDKLVIDQVRAPKIPERLPNTLNESDLNRMLDKAHSIAQKEDTFTEIRNYAIYELLYGSALRVSELVSLDIYSINFDEQFLSVIGKGNKERHVPIPDIAFEAILNYLPYRSQHLKKPTNALFIGKNGTRLSTRRVEQCVKAWAIENRIPFKVTPHTLRHSFASTILQNSGDIRAVQELLGHANISTTQIYTHLNFKEIAELYKKTHPRCQLKNPFGEITAPDNSTYIDDSDE